MDKIFDSNEELHFSWYLEELLENELISEWNYNKKSLEITHKQLFPHNNKEYNLLRNMEYTYDFDCTWTTKGLDLLCAIRGQKSKKKYKDLPFKVIGNKSYIDVKGIYTHKNRVTDVTFPIKQKIIYALFDIYVQKIIPIKLMSLTFYPTKYIKYMEYKNKIGTKIKTQIIGIKEWLELA